MFVVKVFIHPLADRGIKRYTDPTVAYLSRDFTAIQRAVTEIVSAAGIDICNPFLEQVVYEIPDCIRDLVVMESRCPIYFVESEADFGNR